MPTIVIPMNDAAAMRTAMNAVWKAVDEHGYALATMEVTPSNDEALERHLHVIQEKLGKMVADDVVVQLLHSEGSDERLAAHAEGIYCPGGITPYFSLSCIQSAVSGGQTRVFDAKLAAHFVEREHAGLGAVRIRYGSQSHPGVFATHDLIEDGALRYRGKVHTNTMLNVDKDEEDAVYLAVNSALERSLLLAHEWRRGDILIVDNQITVHDRMPFQGSRIMLRARYRYTGQKTSGYSL